LEYKQHYLQWLPMHDIAFIVAGALPGIWIGSHLMQSNSERLLHSLLSLPLAGAGLKLIAW